MKSYLFEFKKIPNVSEMDDIINHRVPENARLTMKLISHSIYQIGDYWILSLIYG